MRFRFGSSGDRRGVSEVISSLLIILIAVAMGVTLFAYGSRVVTSSQSNFQYRTTEREAKTEERFTETTAYYNATEDRIYFAIYNYGKREVTISSVYVNNDQVDSGSTEFFDLQFDPFGSSTINSYELIWIRVPSSGSSPYGVVVVSERGNTIEFEV
jgi:hypothetical protein